jgi:4-amino-4-deoxy-L-arabinose transferase-like glycosyltransferase
MDTTLTFFTTASLFCFSKWYQEVRDEGKKKNEVEVKDQVKIGAEEKRKNRYIYGFYISMAFATLTKGPVGFILPLLVSLTYLLFQKDWKTMKRMRLLPGMALFMAIVFSWYFPAVLKGGKNYLDETLFRHSINRFAEGTTHVRPIYYYFYNFPVEFLPWFFFLPAGLVYGFSKGMVNKRKEFLFLFLWFIVIFIFFPLSKGKRSVYLLPLFPAASIMVGKLWDDFISSSMEYFRNEWTSFRSALLGAGLTCRGCYPMGGLNSFLSSPCFHCLSLRRRKHNVFLVQIPWSDLLSSHRDCGRWVFLHLEGCLSSGQSL